MFLPHLCVNFCKEKIIEDNFLEYSNWNERRRWLIEKNEIKTMTKNMMLSFERKVKKLLPSIYAYRRSTPSIPYQLSFLSGLVSSLGSFVK